MGMRDISHTYIHNWVLQPFSQDYDLASYITHVVRINFIREWLDVQFNVDSERQIFFKKICHFRFPLVSEFLPEICWEEIAYFFHVSFWWLSWYAKLFMSNKPSHYLLDYGNFTISLSILFYPEHVCQKTADWKWSEEIFFFKFRAVQYI